MTPETSAAPQAGNAGRPSLPHRRRGHHKTSNRSTSLQPKSPRFEGIDALREDERVELVRLRKHGAELQMRCDVLKRSVALWVEEAMGR